MLSQHDSVKDSSDPHYSKLPPSVAEALRRPIEGWNIFVLGDADLMELDSARIGPQEQIDVQRHIAAATPILEPAALNRKLTTEKAGNVLAATLKAANTQSNNINTRQAQNLADGTSKNFIFQIIRRAYLFCQDILNPQTDESKQLALEYKKGVAKTLGSVTAASAVASATAVAHHSAEFFEFVALHSAQIKEYISVTLQNIQLTHIVDTIEFTRKRLLNRID